MGDYEVRNELQLGFPLPLAPMENDRALEKVVIVEEFEQVGDELSNQLDFLMDLSLEQLLMITEFYKIEVKIQDLTDWAIIILDIFGYLDRIWE